jgi:hypothetical protein
VATITAFEVDPLLCPSCGGKMSIIAHLKLTFMAERPPPQSVQQELLMADEEMEEYYKVCPQMHLNSARAIGRRYGERIEQFDLVEKLL